MTLGEFAPGFHICDPVALRARLNAYVEGFGIVPPHAMVANSPAIARMVCPIWWRRALRRSQARELEAAAIRLGFVHRKAEIYASNATVERRGQQRRRNALNLEAMDAVNIDTGEVLNLAKIAELSVANPRIRRGELMTRIGGFELVARGLGHAAEFITLTCPSKFHAQRVAEGGAVEVNPKHDGSTPRGAQKYLSGVWARIRAQLARLDVRPYGFRIAEPHHDGCPHWHILLFVAAHQVEVLRGSIRDHALRVDGDEPGAAKNRVEFVAIDPARGSAAGYVAKYVSKNIEGGGYQVQGDLEGVERAEITPAHRVEAWASTWGIRQFQQVGGPPVGVWRELRRLPESDGYTVTIETARAAADCGTLKGHDELGAAGNWRRYVEVQGGPLVKRDELRVTLAKTQSGQRWDAVRGVHPSPLSRYGEEAAGAVYGVFDALAGRSFDSDRGRWEIKRRTVDVGAGFWGSRTRGNNCTQGEEIAGNDAGKEGCFSEYSGARRTQKPDGEDVAGLRGFDPETTIGNYRKSRACSRTRGILD
jgi:hypothetical protein